MAKKEVLIGLLVGLASTLAGTYLYIAFFSKTNFEETIQDALTNDYLGSLITLGAILNFLPFFVFLKKKQLYRVRGVLLATLLVAIAIAVIKIYNF